MKRRPPPPKTPPAPLPAFDVDTVLEELPDNLGRLEAMEPTAPPFTSGEGLTVARSVFAKLLHHAASAAQLVGHLDDGAHPELVRQIDEHVDTIVHELTELLGDPDAVARAGAPMLTAITGGAP
jgi:hypothetical protein